MKNMIYALLTVFLILAVTAGIAFGHGTDPNISTENVLGMHITAFVLGVGGYFLMLKEFPQKLLGYKKLGAPGGSPGSRPSYKRR